MFEEFFRHDDALSLEIGRTARAHVRLDDGLRRLHRRLRLPKSARRTNEITSTVVLADECKAMLADLSSVSAAFLASAVEVLDAVEDANRERNRVVHDMWLPDVVTGDSEWLLEDLRKPAKDPEPANLDRVRRSAAELDRVRLRVFGLDCLLHATGEDDPFKGLLPGGPETWMALMEGRFRTLPTGAFEIIPAPQWAIDLRVFDGPANESGG